MATGKWMERIWEFCWDAGRTDGQQLGIASLRDHGRALPHRQRTDALKRVLHTLGAQPEDGGDLLLGAAVSPMHEQHQPLGSIQSLEKAPHAPSVAMGGW